MVRPCPTAPGVGVFGLDETYMQTKGKTGLIALMFLALIELVILGFLLDEVPTVGGDPDATSSCSDGVQSGSEEGIDCGLVACGIACAPTEVLALD